MTPRKYSDYRTHTADLQLAPPASHRRLSAASIVFLLASAAVMISCTNGTNGTNGGVYPSQYTYDAVTTDAVTTDAVTIDAGIVDVATPDTVTTDVAPDTTSSDTALIDATTPPDTAQIDAPDTSTPNTSTPDTSTPDADTNTSTPDTCQATTCAALGKTCGQHADGCGKTLNCGPKCPVCSPICPNNWACSATATCVNGKQNQLDLDVKTIKISGSVTHNGATPTLNCNSKYKDSSMIVRFVETTWGYTFTHIGRCTDADPFAFALTLYPGTYKVTVGGYDPYGSAKHASSIPMAAQTIHAKLLLTKSVNSVVLDVKTVKVSGVVTLNGKTPTLNCNPKYKDTSMIVRFVETTWGYTFSRIGRCSDTDPFAFALTIYPGTYKVTVGGYDPYGSAKHASDIPMAAQVVYAKLPLNKTVNALTLDVKTMKVSGIVTLNGVKPTLNCNPKYKDTSMVVRFVETTFGYSFTHVAYCSHKDPFAFALTLYPGTYKVTVGGFDPYGSAKHASTIPMSAQVVYAKLQLSKTVQALQLDVKTIKVTGVVTLNGVKPTLNCNPQYKDTSMIVRFVEVTWGYSFTRIARCTDADPFAFALTLYPGTYKVTVGGYDPYGSAKHASNLPMVAQVVYPKLVLTKAVNALVLDVKTMKVNGVVTLNGMKPTLNCNPKYKDSSMSVRFVETTWGYSFVHTGRCSHVDPFAFALTMYPGTYKVTVGGYDPYGSAKHASDIPMVAQVIYPKLLLTKAVNAPTPTVLTLNVKTVKVTGIVTINGVKPTLNCNPKYKDSSMAVRFVETTWGYTFNYTGYCSHAEPFTFALTLYPGTYKVTVGGYDPYGSAKHASTIPMVAQVLAAKLVVQ